MLFLGFYRAANNVVNELLKRGKARFAETLLLSVTWEQLPRVGLVSQCYSTGIPA